MLRLTRPIICFDLETTGTNFERDRVIQIGLIRTYPDGNRTEWSTYVNPEMPIPAEAIEVHGITDDIVSKAPKFSDLIPQLLRGFDNCDFIGYNVKFDLSFIAAEFRRAKVTKSFFDTPVAIVDPCTIFKKHEARTLVAAARFFLGKDFTKAHDALADVKMTLEVLDAQIKRYGLPATPNEIDAIYEAPAPNAIDRESKLVWKGEEACINFGKHAGTPLKKLDRGYLSWMLNGSFSNDVKQIIKDALNGKFPTK